MYLEFLLDFQDVYKIFILDLNIYFQFLRLLSSYVFFNYFLYQKVRIFFILSVYIFVIQILILNCFMCKNYIIFYVLLNYILNCFIE